MTRRYRWRCPTCGAYGVELDAAAAYAAGTGHYVDEHDPPAPVSLSAAGQGLARSVPLSPGVGSGTSSSRFERMYDE